MRIPSQFNDSSLYRPRRGDHNSRNRAAVTGGADTRRRLIRLAVALLLVIVVMKEARRPGLYQTFFGAEHENWVSISPETETETAAKLVAQSGATASDGVTPRRLRWESSASWVAAMDLPLQRSWTETLFRLQSHRTDSDPAAWAGLTEEQIAASVGQLELQVEIHDAEIVDEIVASTDRMRSFAESGESTPGFWDEISAWATPLIDALQEAAFTRVADGTFWTSADSDAFYLSLARANQLSGDEGVTTGTLPMLQQPEIYRGQVVRLAGTLQLAEQKAAQTNRVGIDRYWKLWIIPADGGIRPTILMTRSLPKVLADCLTDDGKWNRKSNPANPDGQIVVVGRFIKRLPYRSSIGADLAPVVVGRVVGAKGIADADGMTKHGPDQPGNGQTASGIPSNGLLGMLLAVVGGVSLAGILMYRSAIDARRTRQLRNRAGDSVTLELNDIGNLNDDPQPTDENEK